MNEFNHVNEDVSDLAAYSREEQEAIAKKHQMRSPGHSEDQIQRLEKEIADSKKREQLEKARKDKEKHQKEKKKLMEKKKKQKAKNLANARKAKKRKAFNRKVQKFFHPNQDQKNQKGTQNEDIDISKLGRTNSDEVNFFNQYVASFDFNESAYPDHLIESEDKLFFNDPPMNESVKPEDKLYPVYVMVMHSGSLLSTAIKTVTQSHFSHVTISFDSSMTNMYSFGRKKDFNPLVGGFVKDSIKNDFYKDRNVPYALYVVPSTANEIKMMKTRLDFFIKNRTKFKYDFIGLFKNYLGIADNPEYRWFCSRFVADILNAGRPADKPYVVEPSLMRPEDFLYTSYAIYVTGGVLPSYDQLLVDKLTNKILRTEELRKLKNKGFENIKTGIQESVVLDVNFANPYLEDMMSLHMMNKSDEDMKNYMHRIRTFIIHYTSERDPLIDQHMIDQLYEFYNKWNQISYTAENLEVVKDYVCRLYYMMEIIKKLLPGTKIILPKELADRYETELNELLYSVAHDFDIYNKMLKENDATYNFQALYHNSKYGTTVVKPRLGMFDRFIEETLLD